MSTIIIIIIVAVVVVVVIVILFISNVFSVDLDNKNFYKTMQSQFTSATKPQIS